MNRAERRRAEREAQKKDKLYTLTQAQIDKIKADAVDDAVHMAVQLLLAIPVMVLKDNWWKKTASKSCPKFIDQCLDLYDSYNKGDVTLEDLRQCLLEEAGVELIRSDNPVKYY